MLPVSGLDGERGCPVKVDTARPVGSRRTEAIEGAIEAMT